MPGCVPPKDPPEGEWECDTSLMVGIGLYPVTTNCTAKCYDKTIDTEGKLGTTITCTKLGGERADWEPPVKTSILEGICRTLGGFISF